MRGSKHEKNRKRKRKSRQQAIATEQDDMDNITTGGTLRSAVKRGAIDFIATTKSDTTDIPTTSDRCMRGVRMDDHRLTPQYPSLPGTSKPTIPTPSRYGRFTNLPPSFL